MMYNYNLESLELFLRIGTVEELKTFLRNDRREREVISRRDILTKLSEWIDNTTDNPINPDNLWYFLHEWFDFGSYYDPDKDFFSKFFPLVPDGIDISKDRRHPSSPLNGRFYYSDTLINVARFIFRSQYSFSYMPTEILAQLIKDRDLLSFLLMKVNRAQTEAVILELIDRKAIDEEIQFSALTYGLTIILRTITKEKAEYFIKNHPMFYILPSEVIAELELRMSAPDVPPIWDKFLEEEI